MVGDQPVRSLKSAEWCLAGAKRCYTQKLSRVRLPERGEFEQSYQKAQREYERLVRESAGID